MYVCDVKYPVDPAWGLPLTDDELSYLFDYFHLVLTPCLESRGVVVDDPPSRATFIDSYTSGKAWNPYKNVLGTAGVKWGEINAACPQTPPGFRP